MAQARTPARAPAFAFACAHARTHARSHAASAHARKRGRALVQARTFRVHFAPINRCSAPIPAPISVPIFIGSSRRSAGRRLLPLGATRASTRTPSHARARGCQRMRARVDVPLQFRCPAPPPRLPASPHTSAAATASPTGGLGRNSPTVGSAQPRRNKATAAANSATCPRLRHGPGRMPHTECFVGQTPKDSESSPDRRPDRQPPGRGADRAGPAASCSQSVQPLGTTKCTPPRLVDGMGREGMGLPGPSGKPAPPGLRCRPSASNGVSPSRAAHPRCRMRERCSSCLGACAIRFVLGRASSEEESIGVSDRFCAR